MRNHDYNSKRNYSTLTWVKTKNIMFFDNIRENRDVRYYILGVKVKMNEIKRPIK